MLVLLFQQLVLLINVQLTISIMLSTVVACCHVLTIIIDCHYVVVSWTQYAMCCVFNSVHSNEEKNIHIKHPNLLLIDPCYQRAHKMMRWSVVPRQTKIFNNFPIKKKQLFLFFSLMWISLARIRQHSLLSKNHDDSTFSI